MKEVHRQGFEYDISEPDLHNHNREVRHKWYRSMVNKRVPRKLWDYVVSWVSEVISTSRSSANSFNGVIILTNVTEKNVDIS